MTRTELDAIRARDADTPIWQVTGGSAVCTDRRDLLAYIDELLRVVERCASECAECGGTGRIARPATVTDDDLPASVPCYACADLRAVLG